MSKILECKVGNTSFLVENLARALPRIQFIREFTQNGIDAIQRRGMGSGSIVWDQCDAEWLEEFGITAPKISVIDTGTGMTREQMERSLQEIAVSASGASVDGNFGVGARISGWRSSPKGVVYESWVDGVGHMAWLALDGDRFGLTELTTDPCMDWTDSSVFVARLGVYEGIDAEMPAVIRDSGGCGTRVTFIGDDYDENTMRIGEGAGFAQSHWLAKALNTRYFRIPQGISIRARAGWSDDRQPNRSAIVGQESALRDYAKSSGVQDIEGARVHWWILRLPSEDTSKKDHRSRYHLLGGYTGILHQDELIDVRALPARIRAFGIFAQQKLVCIYVEPTDARVRQDIHRTDIRIDGEPAPWDEWGEKFRENMPIELRQLIEDASRNVPSIDQDDIEVRIARSGLLVEAKEFSALKPSRNGSERMGGPERLRDTSGDPGPGRSPGKPKRQGPGGPTPRRRKIDGENMGSPSLGRRAPSPRFLWTEEQVESFGCGSFPLMFDHRDFEVIINMTHPLLHRLYRKAVEEYSQGGEEQTEHVKSIVMRHVGEHVCGSICNIRGTAQAESWSPNELHDALSQHALVAVCAYPSGVDAQIKQSVAQRFGSRRRPEVA